MSAPVHYVCQITAEQCADLKRLLEERGWELGEAPYTFFRAAKEKTTVFAYTSGKLVVQGKGMTDFVQFLLEPEILHEFSFGLEAETAELPLDCRPHIGVDESGKGDFFGPLCVAAVYTDETSVEALQKMKVRDSKAIPSDAEIARIAASIRTAVQGRFSVLVLKPETYNNLYGRIGNLNRLLAWGHARVIENTLEKVPDCPRALSDQFGNERLIKNALMERGRKIVMEQRTKGESDIAVAAASILARDAFVHGVKQLEQILRLPLPKGASAAVKEAGAKILAEQGKEKLCMVCKTHFKTYRELTGEANEEEKC